MKSKKSSSSKQTFWELVDAAREEQAPQVDVRAGLRQALLREADAEDAASQDLWGAIASWVAQPVVLRGLVIGSASVVGIFIVAFVFIRPEPVALDHLSMMSNLFVEGEP